jgi:predicted SprT family Zn-dependent metalloprotease
MVCSGVDDTWYPARGLPGRAALRAMATRLGKAWGRPDLHRKVGIFYNAELGTTLGRALLDEGRVELNPCLLREHPEEIGGVVAHELAHMVVHSRYKSDPPHGRRFRRLMEIVSAPAEATHGLRPGSRRKRRILYMRTSDTDPARLARVPAKGRRHYMLSRPIVRRSSTGPLSVAADVARTHIYDPSSPRRR